MSEFLEHELIEPEAISLSFTRFQCRHIHAGGTRCGSICLRGQDFCYFHHANRPAISPARLRRRRSRQTCFSLPMPEDRGAIQLALAEVLGRVAANGIDARRASLLLQGLKIAAGVLPRQTIAPPQEPQPALEVTLDPTFGPLAPRHEIPEPVREKTLEEIFKERWDQHP